MGPAPRLRSAFVLFAVVCGIAAGLPAAAQQYEAALRDLGYAPDPLARSPRLVAMGRLTLADDLHNHLNLWDFAGNPTGISRSDTVSTIEYRPQYRSTSSLSDISGIEPLRERQGLAARHSVHSLETWRRTPGGGGTAYGLVAGFASLQVDEAYNLSDEQRNRYQVPAIMLAVNGRLPWIKSDRFDYAVRLGHWLELLDDNLYRYYQLPQGEYLARQTELLPPPDLFSPDQIDVSTLGGGVAFSMRLAKDTRVALGYDRVRYKVESGQQGLRSTSRQDESRPFNVGQASLIGRYGALELGADGRAWKSRSEEFFFWSLSAGQTAEPLTGDGKRLDREEEGTALRTRGRWVHGALELGAGFGTQYRRTIVTPWYPHPGSDQRGFNDFLEFIGFRPGADTLMLPARVEPSRVEERSWNVSGGGSWSLPGGRGVVGVEAHGWQRHSTESESGDGPKPTAWDVRLGGEYVCNSSLRARAGWNYGKDDRDDQTADNTYQRALASAGLGYQPGGTGWSADVAYTYEWSNPDFADPASQRGSRQEIAIQLRWPF